MPGVTGSATCPAGGNPSTTAGKQRYRRAFRRCRPEQASYRRSRTLPEPGHAELVPRHGARRNFGCDRLESHANRRLLPLYQSSGGHYDDGRAEHWSRRRSLLV